MFFFSMLIFLKVVSFIAYVVVRKYFFTVQYFNINLLLHTTTIHDAALRDIVIHDAVRLGYVPAECQRAVQ